LITFEPINGDEVVFLGVVIIFDHILKESDYAIEFFLCKLILFSMQLGAVLRVNIEVKSNKFKLSTILVQNQKPPS